MNVTEGFSSRNGGNSGGGGGIFSKFASSIFGNPSTDLTNEPTIDYNQTIHSFPNEFTSNRVYDHNHLDDTTDNYIPRRYNQSNESTIPTRDYSKPFQYRTTSTPQQSTNIRHSYNNNHVSRLDARDYKDLFNDINDADLERDYRDLLTRLNKRGYIEPDNVTSSLPLNYPGKFIHNSAEKHIDKRLNDLEDEIYHETKLNTKYNEKLKVNDHYKNHTYDKIISKDEKLSNELKTMKSNVEKNNEFLINLNELAEVNNHFSQNGSDSGIRSKAIDKSGQDFEAEYNKLRKEFIEELSNHQFFYKSYQRLMIKYKDLKTKLSNSNSNPNQKIKDKIKLIRSSSSQSTIKSICDNILLDLNENDLVLNSYKLELDAANLKIKQLEQKLENN